MFGSEIKETVYIGVSLILIAAVLGVFAVVVDIRGDFASLKNENIVSFNSLKEYRKYNAYDDKNGLFAEEIITLITQYYDSGLDIYIDAYGLKGILINNETIDSVPYFKKPHELVKNYFGDTILNRKTYWVGLVYDWQDVTTIKKPSDIIKDEYSEITGIVILEASVAN